MWIWLFNDLITINKKGSSKNENIFNKLKDKIFITSKTKVSSTKLQKINTRMTIYNDTIYYEINKDIRNYKKLSPSENEFIKKLPKENLLEIIETYDSCIENIDNIINNKL